MPNWCNNEMTISHDDPKMMEVVVQAWNSEEFLQTLIPCPAELVATVAGFVPDANQEEQQKKNVEKYGYKTWYDWQINNWGTKWDICGDEGVLKNGVMTVGFESAWSPPIAAYQTLVERGYKITAYYFEPGMGFWGSFVNGSDDCYGDDDYVPKDIDRAMNVTATIAQYKEV